MAIRMTQDAALAAAAQAALDGNCMAGRTVALAESCTGGMVSAALTDLAGSSDVLMASFVTYANQVKQDLLNVSPEILETFGAVSLACAWAMANGALARSGADVAVAITGIAGPGGGSDRKPVGLVIFARAVRGQDPEATAAWRVRFLSDDRAAIRRAATLFALERLHPDDAMDPGTGEEDIEVPAP